MSAPQIVVAVYRPHAGKDEALRSLIADHVPALRRLELITERPTLLAALPAGLTWRSSNGSRMKRRKRRTIIRISRAFGKPWRKSPIFSRCRPCPRRPPPSHTSRRLRSSARIKGIRIRTIQNRHTRSSDRVRRHFRCLFDRSLDRSDHALRGAKPVESMMGKDGTETVGLVKDHSGRPIRMVDLPPNNTKRWVTRRKAAVVTAVDEGLISLEEACRRYALTKEEFLAWEHALGEFGLAGLRITRAQQYRHGAKH